MKKTLQFLLEALTSLRLTVVLLVLSMLLVFVATLDQVHLGIWVVQEKYFRSFFIYAGVPGTDVGFPVFPGGYLLGGLLLANLGAAHFLRFKFAWRTSGIWLTHLGLILLLLGEGLTGLFQKDSQLRIDIDETKRYAESVREVELAVIELTNPAHEDVVAIPSYWVEEKKEIQHPKLPFTLKSVEYFPNASLRMRTQASAGSNSLPQTTMGVGPELMVIPTAITHRPDENNWPTAFVEIRGVEGPIGTMLVSTLLVAPQRFSYQNRTFQIELRAKRDYFPFSVTLLQFTHDVYPGTQIPKDYASTVRIKNDDGSEDRQIRIYMNNPMRLAGRAFYQAGFSNNDRTSILQVVTNPAWTMPYISCTFVGVGLTLQFVLSLLRFARRRQSADIPAAQPKVKVS